MTGWPGSPRRSGSRQASTPTTRTRCRRRPTSRPSPTSQNRTCTRRRAPRSSTSWTRASCTYAGSETTSRPPDTTGPKRRTNVTSPDGQPHLSNHHRTTLRQIFQHPVSHNIEWRAVVSLLETVGSVAEHKDGKLAVTVGDAPIEFLDPPAGKDV